MFERFSDQSRAAVVAARDAALHHRRLEDLHLLLGLVDLGTPDLDVDRDTVLAALGTSELPEENPRFSHHAMRVLEHARRAADVAGDELVEPRHLLAGLRTEPDGAAARLLSERAAVR